MIWQKCSRFLKPWRRLKDISNNLELTPRELAQAEEIIENVDAISFGNNPAATPTADQTTLVKARSPNGHIQLAVCESDERIILDLHGDLNTDDTIHVSCSFQPQLLNLARAFGSDGLAQA